MKRGSLFRGTQLLMCLWGLGIILSGCVENSLFDVHQEPFVIVRKWEALGDSTNPPLGLKVTLRNTGDGVAYAVGYTVTLMAGDTVVAEGSTPADDLILLPKKELSTTVWFPELTDHEAYDKLRFVLRWRNERGQPDSRTIVLSKQ